MPRPPLPVELRRKLEDPDTRDLYRGTGLITGRVTDTSGAAVHGAEIRLMPGDGRTLSALTGDFALFAVAGRASIRASAPGYFPISLPDVEVEAGEEVVVELALRPRIATPLPRALRAGLRHRESLR